MLPHRPCLWIEPRCECPDVPTSSTPLPDGLTRLGGTASLPDYIRQLWARRQFARENAVSELRAQHMDTALGQAWHLLNPILLTAIYYLVFDVILNATRGLTNFIVFLTIGVLTYHWAQKAVTGGASTIVGNEGLIRSLQFPRALLPISTVLQQTLAFLPGILVMVAVAVAFGEGVHLEWLLMVPAFVLQLLFILGASFLAARAADVFRDTLNLLPFLFRLVFYGSGVLYAVDSRFELFENWWVELIFIVNPFYALISLWRGALMTSYEVPHLGWLWISAVVWTVVILVVGLLVFRAGEKDYGRG